jgi:DNA-binding LytR/AlgR family response regulator
MTDVALRVVVSDDEPVAAEALARELTRLGCIVVATTLSGTEAIRACRQHRPDACFTDVSMPGIDGLAVARALRESTSGIRVVFVSAHPHFAVEAYAADVVDFVMKPVRRARLADAVDRVRRATASREDGERLLVAERGTVHLVPIREIEWVQADDYYLWLHTPARSWMLRERMHRLEERLVANDFLRVHRSALVRLSAVMTMDASGPEVLLVLASGARVKVARDRVAGVRARLRTALRGGA